jgi:hypothetical protein
MSFGYSIGDGIALVQLAWNTVQGARKACGEYDELTVEASNLHKVLQRLQRELAHPESLVNHADDDRRQELEELCVGAERILKVMSSVLTKYNALEDNKKSGKKLWQKIKFGNGETQDLADIRQKLLVHTSAILMSLNLCSLGSQGMVENRLNRLKGSLDGIERKVDWVVAGMIAQTEEGTVWTSYADDDKTFWRGLRRELVQEGYSSSTLQKYKGLIKAYVEELGKLGVFDETASDTENFADLPLETSTSKSMPGLQSTISADGLEMYSLPVDQRSSQLQPLSKNLHATFEVSPPPKIQEMIGGSVYTSPAKLDVGPKDAQTATEIPAPPDMQRTSEGSSSPLSVQLDEVLDEDFAPKAHPNVDLPIIQTTYPQVRPSSNSTDQQKHAFLETVNSLPALSSIEEEKLEAALQAEPIHNTAPIPEKILSLSPVNPATSTRGSLKEISGQKGRLLLDQLASSPNPLELAIDISESCWYKFGAVDTTPQNLLSQENQEVTLHETSQIIPLEENQEVTTHETSQNILIEVDLDLVIDQLLKVRGKRPGKQVKLLEREIRYLCTKAREIFISQPILLEIEAPIKVCRPFWLVFSQAVV